MLSLCNNIHAPFKHEKVEGPTTCLTFLGIQIHVMQTSRKSNYNLMHSITFRNTANAQNVIFLSLIDKLLLVCKVIPDGCIFLCNLFDLSTSAN